MADRRSLVLVSNERRAGRSPDAGNTRRRKSLASRLCHMILVLPFVFVIALAAITFSSLYTKRNELGGGCPLYADSRPAEHAQLKKDELNPGPTSKCMLSMWGEIALAGVCVLVILWFVVKAIAGYSL